MIKKTRLLKIMKALIEIYKTDSITRKKVKEIIKNEINVSQEAANGEGIGFQEVVMDKLKSVSTSANVVDTVV